jgi:hypothetical protein
MMSRKSCGMNFTDPLRHQLRKNSLIDLGIAFFDSAGAYEFAREKKLADQELRPVRHRKSKRLQIAIAVLVIATSMVFGTASAFSQTAASVNDAAERSLIWSRTTRISSKRHPPRSGNILSKRKSGRVGTRTPMTCKLRTTKAAS